MIYVASEAKLPSAVTLGDLPRVYARTYIGRAAGSRGGRAQGAALASLAVAAKPTNLTRHRRTDGPRPWSMRRTRAHAMWFNVDVHVHVTYRKRSVTLALSNPGGAGARGCGSATKIIRGRTTVCVCVYVCSVTGVLNLT